MPTGPAQNDPTKATDSARPTVPGEGTVAMPRPRGLNFDTLPMRLGEYRLDVVLGKGGMGVVFRAEHVRLGKTVAVKVLKPSDSWSAGWAERFAREARAVGRLEHPHIVNATDAGEIDGIPFLVMEFLRGADLGTLAHRLGPLPCAAACACVAQAARGLQHAHERGMVHRDIKPANLMLTKAGVKVLDLGLALLLDAGPGGQTSTGMIMGTADYMAPEQADNVHAVDARADIYSLGCTLYRLLTGRPPYSEPAGTTPVVRTLRAHATDPVPSARALRPDLPAELDAILGRMMAKRPGDRYASAAEVAEALAPFATGAEPARLLSDPKTTAAVTVALPLPTVARRQRRIVLAAALGGALLLVLMIVFSVAGNRQSPIAVGNAPAPAAVPAPAPAVQALAPVPAANVVKPSPFPALDPAWLAYVKALPAKRQLQEVMAELKRRHVKMKLRWHNDPDPQIEGNKVVALSLADRQLYDLTPLRVFPDLRELYLVSADPNKEGDLEDLSPLAGLPLTNLWVEASKVADLTPLRGMPLKELAIYNGCKVTTLEPLRGMPLEHLQISDCPLMDLTPLRDLPSVTALQVAGTNVADLTPLRGRTFTMLHLSYCPLLDLEPLRDAKLTGVVNLIGVKVKDLSPLRNQSITNLQLSEMGPVDLEPLRTLPLEEITLDYNAAKHAAVLKAFPDLKKINNMPVQQFWESAGKGK